MKLQQNTDLSFLERQLRFNLQAVCRERGIDPKNYVKSYLIKRLIKDAQKNCPQAYLRTTP